MASPSIWRHCSWSRRLAHHRCLVFFLGFLTQILVVTSDTNSQDDGMLFLDFFGSDWDMSNNSFDESDVPSWFSTLPSLTSL
ncbi:hypothetical protein BHM03_00005018 [Ensete ventricosum]|nr:hypothetical protein BHM03_00005018 [Ensete ventricosum]